MTLVNTQHKATAAQPAARVGKRSVSSPCSSNYARQRLSEGKPRRQPVFAKTESKQKELPLCTIRAFLHVCTWASICQIWGERANTWRLLLSTIQTQHGDSVCTQSRGARWRWFSWQACHGVTALRCRICIAEWMGEACARHTRTHTAGKDVALLSTTIRAR